MKSRQAGATQVVSAAKAGISVRSGRGVEKGEHRATKERHWRTRQDPLAAVWESELIPLLDREPSLTGITLWDYLDEKYPEQYPERLLRTLQRRVKHWQATQGPEKEVMFRQSVPAGHQGLSDFTHPNTAITIASEAFKHLLYQFRLAYSGWRHVDVIQGGESYSALAVGLQNALHKLGGAPKEHRTDSFDPQGTRYLAYDALGRVTSKRVDQPNDQILYIFITRIPGSQSTSMPAAFRWSAPITV